MVRHFLACCSQVNHERIMHWLVHCIYTVYNVHVHAVVITHVRVLCTLQDAKGQETTVEIDIAGEKVKFCAERYIVTMC